MTTQVPLGMRSGLTIIGRKAYAKIWEHDSYVSTRHAVARGQCDSIPNLAEHENCLLGGVL